MVALTALLDDRSLGLEVAACADAVGGRDIRSAAVTELTAPGRWLQGGELLMTIGLLLPMTQTACRSFVEDATTAGVQALAIGLGADLPHGRPPAPLIEAATHYGVPLIAVPDGVPFIAVTKAVFAALAAEERAELEWALAAQRELTQAAVQPGGLDAVLAAHTGRTEGRACVVDLAARVVSAAGHQAEDLAATLSDVVESMRGAGLHGAAGATWGEQRREVHPLGSHRVRGWLLLERRLEQPAPRVVTSSLVSLLTIEMERRHALDEPTRRRRASAFDKLTRSAHDDLAAASILNAVGLGLGVRRCAAVECAGDEREADELAADVGIALPDVLVRVAGRVVEVCGPDHVDLGAALSRLAPGRPLGIGTLVMPAELGVSLRQARSALAASRLADRAVSADDLGTTEGLALLPSAMLDAFADAVLAPLDRADRGPELLVSLGTFLEANGSWEAAAGALDVHRHTVRNRITKIEQLTGRSLSDLQDRTELALAIMLRRRRGWTS